MKFRFLDWTARPAHIAAQFQVDPRDLWIGIFWCFKRWHGKSSGGDYKYGEIASFPWSLHAYVCLLPMLPLHIYISRTVRPERVCHKGWSWRLFSDLATAASVYVGWGLLILAGVGYRAYNWLRGAEWIRS